VAPCGPVLVVSPLGLSVNVDLSIPVVGVAERFITSTIYKEKGGLDFTVA
jgi:hypothetical protein